MKIIKYRDTDTSIDRAEARQLNEEYLSETLNKVCSPCEFEDFKEWITEESNWHYYHSGAWINTSSLRVISTETLYKKYLDAREIQNQQS